MIATPHAPANCRVRSGPSAEATAIVTNHRGNQRTVVASPYGPYRVRSGSAAYADTIKTATGGGTATSLYAVELQDRRQTRPIRRDETPAIATNRNVGVLEDGRAVRRLTPAECERLQGLPAGWTAGPADTTRYRLIGNAVMVPVAKFLGERIALALAPKKAKAEKAEQEAAAV